jgi:peptide/nickel transport system substrate-binding protein
MRNKYLGLALTVSLLVGACTAAEVEPDDAATTSAPSTETTTSESPSATEGSAESGGSIVVALTSAPPTLDPADHRDRQAETIVRNIFDGLVTRDTRNGVHLELAEAMELVDDTTLEVTLRQGVLFHDGEEMTADDVVFTFNRIIQENAIEWPEPHTSPRLGLIAPLESVEKTGDYTLTMNFSAPFPSMMQLLVHQQIVPQHYLEAVGTEGFVAAPIGTGPFKFARGQLDDQIVLERFDDYWGGAPSLEPTGAACVEEVVFRVVPEASTRVAGLLSGEFHIIQGVPNDQISVIEEADGVDILTAPGTQPKWVELNVASPIFDDARVRQAMNYAIDKDLLIEAVYGSRAEALPGPLSPYNDYVNEALTPYPYDPARALELLAEAGWTDSDADGILDREGEAFSFTLDTLEDWRSLAEATSTMLREIGVDVTVRFWEASVVQEQLRAGERQAYLDDWGDSAFDPSGHFEAKWHSFEQDTPYGRGNYSGYSNARVDELIRAGETTLDSDARQEIYDEAQNLVYEEAPAIFLILPEEIEAASALVSNWEPASDSRINLHDVCIGS